MKKSKFNLSHPASFTAKMGNLVPFCVLDCLPGDTHRIGTRSFIRVQPMLAPLMHQVNFFTQWWFVPYRILWDDWIEFITGGLDGSSAPVFPTMKVTPTTSSLADYFGLPVINKGTNDNPDYTELEVSALPFRAYAMIWNTRYRDEDLQTEIPISYDSGLDITTNRDLERCSWAKDYFTTARPFTQRGAQISVPVGQTTPDSVRYSTKISYVTSSADFSLTIKLDFFKSLNYNGQMTFTFTPPSGVSKAYASNENVNVVGAANDINSPFSVTLSFEQSRSYLADSTSDYNLTLSGFDTSNPKVVSSGSPVVAVSTFQVGASVNIRDLRLAGAVQRYQENSLQWGNRYEEFIQREFKVRPRDARIQRPEYLGGAKTRLQISEVLQTAEGTDTGVGTMRGHGVGAMSSRRIKFTCPEHGVIIGIFSIRPHSITTQGLNRMWRKFSKFDFFTPELAHIGMQEVFQSELYANGENYDTVFGYSDRYDEYRKIPARISGEFRNVLDYWNLARIFEAPPVLNSSFIEMNPSTRIFAEQNHDQFLCMLQNDIFSYRPVPKKAKNILM